MRRNQWAGVIAAALALVATATWAMQSPGSSHRTAPSPAPSAVPLTATPTPRPHTGETAEPTTLPPNKRERPNVVVAMLDDLRWDELAYAPNARRFIGDRGITFRNSFAPFPLCCPARASFLSGQYAHNHGVLSHVEPYGFGAFDDHVSIGTRLQAAGYRTAMIGKYLNGYGEQPSRVTGQPSVNYVPAGWTDWMAGLDNGGGLGGGTYDYFNLTQNINGTTTVNPGRYSSTVIADQAIGLVRDYSTSQQPFLMWLNPVAPHHGEPFEYDDPDPTLGGPAGLWTPARPDWVKGRFDSRIRHSPGLPASGADPEERMGDKPRFMRKAKPPSPAARLGVLSLARQRAEAIFAWDRQFGRVIRELKRTGEFDDTILMLTSDNGFLLGEHRVLSGKILPHEPSLRVPLMVSGPGVQHGTRVHPVTTMDLTATVLDVAGVKQPRSADGASFQRLLTGPDQPWRVPMLTEGYFPGLPRLLEDFPALSEVGIRTGRYKYVRWASDQEELYDLAKDPNEFDSRHRDPAYAGIKAQLAAIWERMKDCKGTQCQQPLPASLTTSVRDLGRIADNFDRQRSRYYGSVN